MAQFFPLAVEGGKSPPSEFALVGSSPAVLERAALPRCRLGCAAARAQLRTLLLLNQRAYVFLSMKVSIIGSLNRRSL
jgi:hypothetical protein